MLKLNLLAVVGFGVLVALLGMVLYVFREMLADYIRFILPIPPLSVAAYVFVINFFRQYSGKLPDDPLIVFRELFMATAVAALVFGLLSVWLILLLDYARQYF